MMPSRDNNLQQYRQDDAISIIGSAAAENKHCYHQQRLPRRHKRRKSKTNEKPDLTKGSKFSLSSSFCDASTWRNSLTGKTTTANTATTACFAPKPIPCSYDGVGEVSMALPSLLRLRETGLLSRRSCENESLLPTILGRSSGDPCFAPTNLLAIKSSFASLLLLTTRDRLKQGLVQNSANCDLRMESKGLKKECCNNFRPCWRPYAKRVIPFSHLETPPCDAVLGISRDGSFLIAIGPPPQCHEASIKLALRFYGIPSPHALYLSAQKKKKKETVSPVLCLVPIRTISSSANYGVFEDDFETRVDILIASNIGIAFILPQENEDNEMLGSLVIFSIPYPLSSYYGNENKSASVLQSSEVTIKTTMLSARKDILWPTTIIPALPNFLSHASKNIPFQSVELLTSEFNGYLLFNDEADGYRLCWIQLLEGNEFKNKLNVSRRKSSYSSRLQYGAETSIISIPVVDVEWEPIINHLHDNENCNSSSRRDSSHGDVKVALMAYLHVDALLIDVLSRRCLSFTTRQLPNFSYNLVSVEAGRMVELVIVFRNNEISIKVEEDYKPLSLGLFVRLDLLTLSYEEMDWIYSDDDLCDEIALSNWSVSLSKNRLKIRKLKKNNNMLKDPLTIWNSDTCGSLYIRFCDHFTNEAVVAMKPLRSLQSSASPVSLNYE